MHVTRTLNVPMLCPRNLLILATPLSISQIPATTLEADLKIPSHLNTRSYVYSLKRKWILVIAEWFEKIFENLLGHAGVRSKNENVRGTTFKVELHYYVHG